MRVLIVADAPSALEADELRTLAADCDAVIAADGGGARCLEAGIAADVVVGDLDSLAPDAERALRGRGVPFVTAPAEKDVSDLDLAIDRARAMGAGRLVVCGVIGGRLDHELSALGSLARASDLAPEIRAPGVSARVLSPSGTSGASVEGGVFSLMALLAPARVTCSGARWMLTNARLEPISSLGLSNHVPEGSVAEITVHDGVVLLYLP
jgi:thiamine pyrophosphokinase